VLAVVLVIGLALGGISLGVGLFPNPVAMAQEKLLRDRVHYREREREP
jgi:hypothetical protein